MKKYTYTLSLIISYIIIVLLVQFAHNRYFKVDVVFYSAIFDSFLAILIISFFIYHPMKRKIYTNLEVVLLTTVLILGGYSYAISIPTVIDRSLSFYLIEKVQQHGGSIKVESLDEIFINDYLKEHHLMEVRLTEQLESGTVRIEGNCLITTPKGDFLASASRFYRLNFLPKKRQLLGSYSDTLTDPFRKNDINPQYLCSIPN